MNSIDTMQLTSKTRGYLELWVQAISKGLEQFINARVTAEAIAGEDPSPQASPASDTGVWIRLDTSKAGEQAFFLAGAEALRLSQLIQGKPADQAGMLGEDDRKMAAQFFRQIAAKIPLSDWLGPDSAVKVSGLEAPEWESSAGAVFRFFTPQNSLLILHTRLSQNLAAALQRANPSDSAEETNTRAGSSPPIPSGAGWDMHLDLLMDIELEVTLRFGQREMLLKDVLNLAPGTVVELDQQVQDPVELLVGNKVIAWGEVVAVDGNYGLRITGLASREERLESLRK